MFFGKIPVWVYTAKNGYDWQGLDGGEDGATKASLDKALGAAGKTAGAWGAVVRRPVASRRWAEWPRSRLCWVLFRFHPDAGRDQRGRACNYTAAACIPVGEKLPRLDFAKIFAAPEMAEVRTDGYGEMAIDLDGADYVLRETDGGGEGAEPSWEASWAVPELRKEDALGTLSRWCQSEAVDRGDLKAVLREEAENGGELMAHMTYAVFPQVAALQTAEKAYETVAGQGVGVALREALSGWRKALATVEDFNRALGGLVGLGLLVEERTQAWKEAAGAADAAERTARERAAAAASAAAAADELSRAIARYRFSADVVYGKEDNRRRLAELEQMLATGRARHGEGGRWNELEVRIDHLRQWTGIVDGNLDTVRTYRDAAERGGAGLVGLEAQARAALEQVRGLYQSGHGVFVSDALREMERLFGIAQAQKAPLASMVSSAANGGNVPPRAPKPELTPVTHGYKGAKVFKTDGDGRARDGGGHRRRDGWKRWWGRWWEVVACVATILVAAATLGGIWGGMRRGALKEWEGIRGAACGQAERGQYSEALATMSKLPPHKLLLLRRSRFGKELREKWEALVESEGKSRKPSIPKSTVEKLEKARREEDTEKWELEALEMEKKGSKLIQIGTNYARGDWKRYEDCRKAAEDCTRGIRFNAENVPYREKDGKMVCLGDDEIKRLAETYEHAATNWREARIAFSNACQTIETGLGEDIRELQEQCTRMKDENARLKRLENDHNRYRAAQGDASARGDWQEYRKLRQQAVELTKDLDFDADGLPIGMQGPLEKNNLPTMLEKCRKGEKFFSDACVKLETAYQKLDKGKGKEADDVLEEEVEAEKAASTEDTLEGKKPTEVHIPATMDGNAGEAPAPAQSKDKGFLRGLFGGRGGDEPPPAARLEAKKKEGGVSAPASKAIPPGAPSGSASVEVDLAVVSAEAAAGTVPDGTTLVGTGAGEAEGPGQEGTDASEVDASSKENAK